MPLNSHNTEILYNEVFISYSRENQAFAQRIVQAIYDSGRKNVWIDWEDIPHGADWWESIEAGIDSADNFIFILSPASINSEVCNNEVDYAVKAGKRIITIEHQKIVDPLDKALIHPSISAHNWLPFKEEDDFAEGIAELLETIETDLRHVRFHTRLQTRAREWQQRKGNPAYLLSTGELAEAQAWLAKASLDDKRPIVTKLQIHYIEASQKAEDRRKAAQEKIARRVQRSEQASTVLAIITLAAIIAVFIAGLFIVGANQRVGEADVQVTEAAFKVLGAGTEAAQKIIEADIQIVQARGQAAAPLTQAASELNQAVTQVADLSSSSSTQMAEIEFRAETQVAQINMWQVVAQNFNCEDGYCVEMLLAPPGCFEMGTDTGSRFNERPVHLQCITDSFWIDRYEVSNEQFAALNGQSAFKGVWPNPQQPQAAVTWVEALAFCQLRGGTLPSEAQWEYAARGRNSLDYPWGNTFISDYVVYSENSTGQPVLVGTHPEGASWLGAMDMIGNVAEWTSTIHEPTVFHYPYLADDGRENLDDNTAARVVRGGSFLDNADELYAAKRSSAAADTQESQIGFRCIRPLDAP